MTNTIKIATWNVNSINARLENLIFWIKNSAVDVILLQELKCTEDNFPFEAINDLGYNIAIHGQKSYNGVAILSKFPLEDVKKNLPNFNDEQSRYIEAVIPFQNTAIRVASIYVPNGGAELAPTQKVNETDKFLYKMNFYDHLYTQAKHLLSYNEITILGGDYNVCHHNIDAYDPVSLKNTVCFHDDERKKFRSLLNLGYQDSFRSLNPNLQAYSWWDYRGNSWKFNKGLRIDYLLASPLAADKLKSCYMDEKMNDREKPSDHCPVVCELILE
jgi:exodeoxyribonuclease-3